MNLCLQSIQALMILNALELPANLAEVSSRLLGTMPCSRRMSVARELQGAAIAGRNDLLRFLRFQIEAERERLTTALLKPGCGNFAITSRRLGYILLAREKVERRLLALQALRRKFEGALEHELWRAIAADDLEVFRPQTVPEEGPSFAEFSDWFDRQPMAAEI